MRSALGLAIFLPLAILLGCTKPTNGPRPTPPAPVIVIVAAKKTVPVRLRTIGSVKSLASVAIRPRVGGQLTGVLFKEGDYVKKGQKLFTIDPRPYEAAVKQAEANMAKNDALLKGAELDLKRAETARQAASGRPRSTTPPSPPSPAPRPPSRPTGCAQHRQDPGRLHHHHLAARRPGRRAARHRGQPRRRQRHDPARRHQPDQPDLRRVHAPRAATPGRRRGPEEGAAQGRGGPPRRRTARPGKLAFIDNAADPLTGTVQFKAEFQNADQKLWPGLFVDVVLTLGERPDSVVVPSAAVQSGQKGQYVYVVDRGQEGRAAAGRRWRSRPTARR